MKFSIYYIIICSLLFGNSCKKFVEVPDPSGQITSSKVFDNDQTALSALAGIYISMSTNSTTPIITNGAVTIYTGLASDELIYNGTVSSDKEFANNSISPTNSVINNNFWRQAYQLIYQTNAVLEGTENSNKLSMEVKERIIGETKFLRAFLFFYLTNLFGDVPLITSTDYQENSIHDRTSISMVYEQIIADLIVSNSLLSSTYPTSGRLRINKWAASTLLARVYLYVKEWAKAEQLASEVINSGDYSLNPELDNVFLPESEEVIWQLFPFASTLCTTEGNKFIPSSSPTTLPIYSLSSNLFNAFEVNDERSVKWIKSKTVSGITYHYPYKYKVRSIPFGSTPIEYTTMLRFAELYLIRAEARAKQANFEGSIQDLNKIRQRVGLTSIQDTITDTELFQAIEEENMKEFFAEWGHRWFDLKRTERSEEVLEIKSDWQPTDILFPIPHSQILLNPALVQNPGY